MARGLRNERALAHGDEANANVQEDSSVDLEMSGPGLFSVVTPLFLPSQAWL